MENMTAVAIFGMLLGVFGTLAAVMAVFNAVSMVLTVRQSAEQNARWRAEDGLRREMMARIETLERENLYLKWEAGQKEGLVKGVRTDLEDLSSSIEEVAEEQPYLHASEAQGKILEQFARRIIGRSVRKNQFRQQYNDTQGYTPCEEAEA